MNKARYLSCSIGKTIRKLTSFTHPITTVFLFSGFEIQKKFLKAVVTYLQNSFDSRNTQSAIVVFADSLTSSTPYIQDYTSVIAYIDGMSHKKGLTNLVAGLREARRIIVEDPNSRKHDVSVRKLVFFLTDGKGNREQELYPKVTEQLKNVVSFD